MFKGQIWSSSEGRWIDLIDEKGLILFTTKEDGITKMERTYDLQSSSDKPVSKEEYRLVQLQGAQCS